MSSKEVVGSGPGPGQERECVSPRALLIVAASFLCNGLIFGVINSYSVFYVHLLDRLTAANVSDAASKASLVGSLAMGATFMVSPVAGILTDRFGLRLTTFGGGLLASSGMFLSSLTSSTDILCLTYGVMFGTGASLVYTPSLVILGHYFKRYLGVVNGIAAAGSSAFTIIMPYAIGWLISTASMESCMQVLAALMALTMLCAFLFKPVTLPPAPPQGTGAGGKIKTLINLDIWKKKKYVIWACSVPVALLGYFVPYIHMLKFVEDNFPDEDGKLLILCLGATSGLGRLLFGKIADIPRINRIFLQQISFTSIGLLTIILPLVKTFGIVIAIALIMGIFDGCFVSLMGPIAFEICGQKGASQAIGFILGLCSIPLTAGPPIAGIIYDHTKTYKIPFLLAGIPPIVGSIALLLVRCVKSEAHDDAEIEDKQLQVVGMDGATEAVKLSVIANGDSTTLLPTYQDLTAAQPGSTNSETGCITDLVVPDEEESLLDEVNRAIVEKTT